MRRLTLVEPMNHVLNGSQDGTNPLAAARGDKSVMRPLAQLLWTLVVITSVLITVTLLRLRCRGVTIRGRSHIHCA